MAKKLQLMFTNEDGQPTTILIQQPDQNLSAAEVRKFMEDVSGMRLFRHKGQMKYAVVKGARYVDRQTEILF